MCGIVGFFGNDKANEYVIDGLKKLEYRGYDSWGIAVKQEKGNLFVKKAVGKISEAKTDEKESKIAVGHTRWATHGKVTETNAHPHLSNNKKIAVVHNGIIENYQALKKMLKGHGFVFETETDTEVVPNLIEFFLQGKKLSEETFLEAVKKTLKELQGHFALGILHADLEIIIGIKKGSPLIVGIAGDGTFIASDVSAFLKHTKKVVFLEDNEIIVITAEGRKYYSFELERIRKKTQELDINAEELDKQEFAHYMLKEIMEQKDAISNAISQDDERIKQCAKAINESFGSYLIGCGTAGKVALAGTYLFSKIAHKHVNFTVGSEFINYLDFIKEKSLVIAISQSGETADTLEAIRAAKKKKAKIMSIVNAVGTTMERLSDYVIPVRAGIEKSVASTKATTAQMAILTLLAYASIGKLEEGKNKLFNASKQVGEMLNKELTEKIKTLAKKLKEHESMYIIGRGLNYPIALESAIKLQEISYIHAEGFAGGELKHGPLALISNGTPCIALVSEDENKTDILNNAMEIKARGGYIIGIAPENNEVFDYWIQVPDLKELSIISNLIPVQLLAYYLGIEKGHDVDYPRNLAKSVTVK